jgi:hypothetical protein
MTDNIKEETNHAVSNLRGVSQFVNTFKGLLIFSKVFLSICLMLCHYI